MLLFGSIKNAFSQKTEMKNEFLTTKYLKAFH